MATNVSRRFAETTEEEIQTKRLKLNADNTLKANKKSANILREYLKEKNQDSLFENYDTEIEQDACSLLHGLEKTRWREVQGYLV